MATPFRLRDDYAEALGITPRPAEPAALAPPVEPKKPKKGQRPFVLRDDYKVQAQETPARPPVLDQAPPPGAEPGLNAPGETAEGPTLKILGLDTGIEVRPEIAAFSEAVPKTYQKAAERVARGSAAMVGGAARAASEAGKALGKTGGGKYIGPPLERLGEEMARFKEAEAAAPLAPGAPDNLAYDVMESVPSLAGAVAGTALAGPAGGMAAMGVPSYGRRITEARERGLEGGQAQTAAISGAAVEAALERFGEIPIAKAILGEVPQQAIAKGIQLAKNAAGEGVTEALQSLADKGERLLFYEDEEPFSIDDVTQAIKEGAAGSILAVAGVGGAQLAGRQPAPAELGVVAPPAPPAPAAEAPVEPLAPDAPFEAWLVQEGWEPQDLTEAQRTKLRQQYHQATDPNWAAQEAESARRVAAQQAERERIIKGGKPRFPGFVTAGQERAYDYLEKKLGRPPAWEDFEKAGLSISRRTFDWFSAQQQLEQESPLQQEVPSEEGTLPDDAQAAQVRQEEPGAEEAQGQGPPLGPETAPPAAPPVQEAPAVEPEEAAPTLPARMTMGQAGSVNVGGAWTDFKRYLRKKYSSRGFFTEGMYQTKVERDGRIAKMGNRIDSYGRQLDKAIRTYKGPLSHEQLTKFLDESYRWIGDFSEPDADAARKVAERSEIDPDLVRSELPLFAPLVSRMRQFNESLADRLEELGLLDADVRKESRKKYGYYLHRQYYAFRDPKWVDKAKANPLWNRARQLAAEENPALSDEQLDGLLEAYASRMQQAVLPGNVPEGSRDMSPLRQRKDLDEVWRDLLGEVRSLPSNFVTSAVKMSTLIEQTRFLTELEAAGKEGGVFFERPMPGAAQQIDPGFFRKNVVKLGEGAQVTVKQGRGRSGPVGGLYTSKDVMEELDRLYAHKDYPKWVQMWMRASWAVKGAKTVGSVQGAHRNLLSNEMYAMSHGVAPFGPWSAASREARLAYGRVFVGVPDGILQQRLERYLELGMADQGTDIGDLKRMEKMAMVFQGDIPYGPGRTTKKAIDKAGEYYNAADNFAKFYIFERLWPQYQQAMGVSQEAAEAHVARMMRDTAQNYSAVPEGVRELANAPIIAPFISFHEEVVRNFKNLIKISYREMRSDNPGLRKLGAKKAAGMLASLSIPSTIAFASRYLWNMDREDDEAIRRFAAPWNKNSVLIHLGKSKGKEWVVDFSFMDLLAGLKAPIIAAIRGEPEQVVDDLLRPFSEDIFTKAVIEAYTNKNLGTGAPVFNEQRPFLGRQWEKGKYLGKALAPGTVLTGMKLADPERNRWLEALAMLGIRVTPIDIPKSLGFRALAYREGISGRAGARAIVRKAIRDGDDVEKALRQSSDAIRRLAKEMALDVAAARKRGYEDDIEGALDALADWEVEALMEGDVEGVVEHYRDLDEGKIEEAGEE